MWYLGRHNNQNLKDELALISRNDPGSVVEHVLNRRLLGAVLMLCGTVEIVHAGERMIGRYVPVGGSGRWRLEVIRYGEGYNADCPFCGESLGIWVSHRFGISDHRTGGTNCGFWSSRCGCKDGSTWTGVCMSRNRDVLPFRLGANSRWDETIPKFCERVIEG